MTAIQLKKLQKYLRQVVTSDKRNRKKVSRPSVRCGGKSGTAQTGSKDHKGESALS
ncbi:penicillin-binding transpeptidase domain-containing protein [Bacillus sp. SL00103]